MFSLVIPTFNRADLIGETIESALSQSLPFSEILVIDDGSTDHTWQVLAGFGDRIKTIRTANQGVQAARNTGVEAAQGEYITLCDSDDLLENTFLEVMSSWLRSHAEIDIAWVNFRTFSDTSIGADKFSQAPPDWFDGALRSDAANEGASRAASSSQFCWAIPELYVRTVVFQPLFPTGQTFRKSFYQSIDGYNSRFNGVGGEDWEFTLRAIAAGEVALCMQPLARVRKHAGNDSANLVRQLLGEAEILEHALHHHGVATSQTSAMRASIAMRRLDAFDHAYATGDFAAAGKILTLLQTVSPTPKFLLKKLITRLPSALRKPLWAATQR
ncbi:MAG: glycosyltransferase family 2 protein [Pseudomonadota bacterium]